jgi:glycosyltransferase involved in cell wall biosynthesis
MLDISVVVPVRNAEHILGECLESIRAADPRELIVVDGVSTDGTRDVARRYAATILSDDGRGLPAARLLGVEAATSPWVALVDADVVVPRGGLERLFAEFRRDGYTGLQAGLESVGGPGYWGRALAEHHRSGVSKNWFGVVATIFDREALLAHGFDDAFRSGEDIDLRWRLKRAGAKVGVSRETHFTHRFDDTFEFARGQWLADGRGLGRMVRRHGAKAWLLAGLPLVAGARGIVLSLWRREPRWVPYYVCFSVFNYVGMAGALRERMAWRLPHSSEETATP